MVTTPVDVVDGESLRDLLSHRFGTLISPAVLFGVNLKQAEHLPPRHHLAHRLLRPSSAFLDVRLPKAARSSTQPTSRGLALAHLEHHLSADWRILVEPVHRRQCWVRQQHVQLRATADYPVPATSARIYRSTAIRSSSREASSGILDAMRRDEGYGMREMK